ncbi:hypothetical protein ACHAW5_009903 [Stephanodiscus triporus]|uniref:Cyanocobalamin reductase (cyanide-eliminating) n=1 Tax=Stephanodiscus triporus TaxID=2934178 RepID=A0ABD3Q274_9STRA
MTARPSEIENEALSRLRCTPLSWPELKAIILSPDAGELSKLARSDARSKTYRTFRESINDEWESIYDYLLCEKFGFEWVWADELVETSVGGDRMTDDVRMRKRSKPTFREYVNDQRLHENEGTCSKQYLKLCINDFPYYYSPGVQHWILWKLGGVVTSDELANAKEEILRKSTSQGPTKVNDALEDITNDHEVFLHWVNPPHLKSLPGIDHVHILYHGSP